MTEKYLSVNGECQTQKIIEKSRFITTSAHVESEEEARRFIAEICALYPDATHNCYAFIPDITANSPRFSDDGEPQGTAGMPILEVIKSKNLRQVAVVVTRYFGGIKLGAGGLLRAYSGCASENLSSARTVEYATCFQYKITADYPKVDGVLRFLEESGAKITGTEYLNEAVFAVSVRKTEAEKFCANLINRLNGRVAVIKISECFYPFDFKEPTL